MNMIEATAKIICKNEGDVIASGLSEAETIFDICDCNSTILVTDGSAIKKGTAVMDIQGTGQIHIKSRKNCIESHYAYEWDFN